MNLKMKKNQKIKAIEKKVQETFLYHQYEVTMEALLDINYQNRWLVTKEGIDEVGSEKAAETIDKNINSMEQLNSRLNFILKQIK